MLTLGTYSHVVQPIRREAVNRMNELFGSESKPGRDKSGEGEEVQR